MEFHISQAIRQRLDLDETLFSFTGNVVFANITASRRLAQQLNELNGPDAPPEKLINAGALYAMGLIDELSHALVARYRKEVDPNVLSDALKLLTPADSEKLLLTFTKQFPNTDIFRGKITPEKWLAGAAEDLPNREAAFEELMLLWLANANPAFKPFHLLFEDKTLQQDAAYQAVTTTLPGFFAARPPVGPGLGSLIEVLQAPFLNAPDSLTAQLDFIREHWSPILGVDLKTLLLAIDTLREEEIAVWMRFHPPVPGQYRNPDGSFGSEGFRGDEYIGYDEFGEFVTGPDGVRRRRYATDYQAPLNEYEAFSADQAWMPTVVLIAKNTYVWLEQLSKKYLRHIHRLDQIPDEELQILAQRGITGLWLIGLWERSKASQTIKRLCGNADAVSSAYSLMDYSIAQDLGGEEAYIHLRDHAARAGLRLASDMVPNHMGIDSTWVVEHPEWFVSRDESPFPVYSFEGPDVSSNPGAEIKLEDHYYNQSDAAVVFRLRTHRDGRTRFLYHGNDGTTFAWNDTAQLDYSKAEVREHVMQVILNVARRFPIIRFDAAMVLAKRHVQRLWFPLPGAGGSIPSRAENAMSEEQFDALMPKEFWREVVDRVAVEVPGTLLLAEAFWLLEGYFVRTLGMHRVYNSAFMNMLRDEENAKYRSYLKKTVEFDPDIMKRYVNFMSNPDERTAIDQFGSGDKYFGTSVLLATLPGLPMFGHGQVEGFTERYGMDFKQARMDEYPNDDLVNRHNQLIAPLLKNRHIFAESTNFLLYDFWNGYGGVDENVFAYSNRHGDQRAIILYNNVYAETHGTIHMSVGFLAKSTGALRQCSLSDGLDLPDNDAIIAYCDTVQGLEYLRRSRDFIHNGLTISLRGYQHMALLNFRVLYSSASHPWDRLCDALGGSGVYSVDDALTQLRMRPLHEALRWAISGESVHAISEAAKATTKAAPKPAVKLAGNAIVPKHATIAAPASQQAAPKAMPDRRLETFAGKVQNFHAKAIELSPGLAAAPPELITEITAAVTTPQTNLTKEHPATKATTESLPLDELTAPAKQDALTLAAAALSLPNHVAALPAALLPAARVVFPATLAGEFADPKWAPVLAWIALHSFDAQPLPREAYEEFHLKPALAEAFSSVGIGGEDAWRASARVRLLLGSPDVTSPAFWEDSDARWLTGVNESNGSTYFNKEQFEELVLWLSLPHLLGAPSKVHPEALAKAAKAASYTLKPFLASFVEEPATATAS